ncbi:MAG TPA: CHAD domain-containing protein, partial [Anaerolineae bacterium]
RPVSRRAAVILAWATGQSTSEIAALIGISAGRARYWIRSFRAHRMEIFSRARDERPATGQAGHPDENSAREAVPVEKPGGQEPAEVADLAAPIVAPAAEAAPAEPGKAANPLLTSEDPMSEAGRAIMYLHFQRMRDNEEGTRAGEDSEALHDMRVATRRMRAAYELFVPYYDEKTVRRFRKGLRRTGRSLGAVRDLDVLLAKAKKFDEQHPAGPDKSLAPMIADWSQQRDDARDRMLEYLDGKAYRSFTEDFLTFLTTPGAGAVARPDGAPVPYQVRHVVPRLLLARYQDVRAYEGVLPAAPLTTYHQLRITCKKLRYAMEFFKDVLDDPVTKLIKQVTSLQDLLGDLHDSVVAEELAAKFLTGQIEQRPYQLQRLGLAGITAYLTAQWTIQHDLLAAFPAQWAELDGYEFRRGLGLAVAVL